MNFIDRIEPEVVRNNGGLKNDVACDKSVWAIKKFGKCTNTVTFTGAARSVPVRTMGNLNHQTMFNLSLITSPSALRATVDLASRLCHPSIQSKLCKKVFCLLWNGAQQKGLPFRVAFTRIIASNKQCRMFMPMFGNWNWKMLEKANKEEVEKQKKRREEEKKKKKRKEAKRGKRAKNP